MAWTSKYNSISVQRVTRQLMAIIQRDQRAALDNVAGVGILPSFVGYYVGSAPFKQFPAVSVWALRAKHDRDSTGTRKADRNFVVAVGVNNQDPETCAELLDDYLEAMNQLLNSFPLSAFYVPLTLTGSRFPGGSLALPGLPATTKIMDLFAESDDSTAVRQVRNSFQMAGVIGVALDVEEPQTY